MATRTEGSGNIEVEQAANPPLPTGATHRDPMWIKYSQSVSGSGVIIERWHQLDAPDLEAAWRDLARKARSRFAGENPY